MSLRSSPREAKMKAPVRVVSLVLLVLVVMFIGALYAFSFFMVALIVSRFTDAPVLIIGIPILYLVGGLYGVLLGMRVRGMRIHGTRTIMRLK